MTNSITKELHRSVLIDVLSRASTAAGNSDSIVLYRIHCSPPTHRDLSVIYANYKSSSDGRRRLNGKLLNSPDDDRFHPDRDSTHRSVKVRNGYDRFSNSQTSHLRPKTMLRIARSVAYDIVQSRSSRKSMMLRHHAGCSANQSIDSKVSHHMYRNTQKQNKTDE